MEGNNELCKLVSKGKKGDITAITVISEKFAPLIKKYSRKLQSNNIDDDSTPLMESIVNSIYKIPEGRDENSIKKYLRKSVENKFYAISKYNEKIKKNESQRMFEIILETKEDRDAIEMCINRILLNQLLDKLSDYQKTVILQIYFYGISVTKLAKKWHISKQAVNKTKIIALMNLRKFASENLLIK